MVAIPVGKCSPLPGINEQVRQIADSFENPSCSCTPQNQPHFALEAFAVSKNVNDSSSRTTQNFDTKLPTHA
jgi:hypothetical protein